MGYHLDDVELYHFNEGTSACAYLSLGNHTVSNGDSSAVRFAVWAPNARAVSVVGEFNGWDANAAPMTRVGETGVWETHIPDAQHGQMYKYAILRQDGGLNYKADPYAVKSELRPGTASRVWDLPRFDWDDGDYMQERSTGFDSPMSIYEVHLASWRGEMNYRDIADKLVDYVTYMGYTHIEIMPVSEYPLDMSWGYQVISYYSITSRYGDPEDFMYFVNKCHSAGIGVILDWVPAHFPRDEHGLRRFDGTALYEHPDPRRGEQPQWGTMLFDYGRTQVQSFLVSNALYFLKEYHIDGLRVDAVSCMLYLDYGKQDGQWLPNPHGGRENEDAIALFRKLTHTVGVQCPGAVMIAEESTAFPLVTRPPEDGGLGFHYKWNMGWMNDTLSYFSMDSIYRKHHHDKLTFSLYYAFSENFILPFSHDEVVHGKCSLINKMPGDYWQKFAQLRLLYAYMFAHPGKKLMFMGDEFGQFIEWKYDAPLDWLLLNYPKHTEVQRFVKELNHFYRSMPQLYRCDYGWEGFEWLRVDDAEHSTAAFMRRDDSGGMLICAFNFTPVPCEEYRIGLKKNIAVSELLNSDDQRFGGTGEWTNENAVVKRVSGAYDFVLNIKLPPYGAVYMEARQITRKPVHIVFNDD